MTVSSTPRPCLVCLWAPARPVFTALAAAGWPSHSPAFVLTAPGLWSPRPTFTGFFPFVSSPHSAPGTSPGRLGPPPPRSPALLLILYFPNMEMIFFFFFFPSLTPLLCQPSPIKCFCPLPCLGIDLAFVDSVPYRAAGSWRAGQALATAGPGPRGGGPPTLTEHPSSCSGGRGTWAVTFAFCTLSVPKRDKNTSQACRRIRWAAPSM